jgi:hypothetical protein
VCGSSTFCGSSLDILASKFISGPSFAGLVFGFSEGELLQVKVGVVLELTD